MGNEHILVVDEAAESRDLLVSILATRDYRPVAARNVEEAISHIGREAPDLVVIDLKFYQPDPWDTYRQLRGCAALDCVPVVALAPDRPPAEDAPQGVPASCRFLVKPFDYSELVDLIGRQLGDSRSHAPQ